MSNVKFQIVNNKLINVVTKELKQRKKSHSFSYLETALHIIMKQMHKLERRIIKIKMMIDKDDK